MNLDKFSSIPLNKLKAEQALPVDIFLKIDEKPVLYRRKGDSIDLERYHHFISKQINSVLIKNEDVSQFIDWLNHIKDQLLEKQIRLVGADHRNIIESNEFILESLVEVFTTHTLTEKIVTTIHQETAKIISTVSKNRISAMALARLVRFDRTLAEHSLNVASLSLFLALTEGIADEPTLNDIYFGGLLHDIGKIKSKNLHDDLVIVTTHPEIGHKMIVEENKFSKLVQNIILSHHELCNGQGFPKRLSKNEISHEIKIVTLANVFSNLITEEESSSKQLEEKLEHAFRYLLIDHASSFDEHLLERGVEALQIAFASKLWLA